MAWKMFGIKGKLISAKQGMFRLVSLLRKEDNSTPCPTPISIVAPYKPANPFTDYSLEAELKRAKALVYARMLDRPK